MLQQAKCHNRSNGTTGQNLQQVKCYNRSKFKCYNRSNVTTGEMLHMSAVISYETK